MRQAPGVLAEPVGERVMLLDPAGRELLTLNPVGTIVWSLLGVVDHRSAAEIAADLRARFPDVDAATVEADAHEFLAELVEAGVVEAG